MFFTYILCSINTGKYYIGSTDNVEKRIQRHNRGYVRSTKAYKPWEIVYTEKFETLSGARSRERQIKSWRKRAAIEKLIGPHRLAA